VIEFEDGHLTETKLQDARAMILEEADALDLAPLTETTKWGQPAFLTTAGQGTTIRLGVHEKRPALFVHCQTSIVADARRIFGDAAFAGNRACLLDEAQEAAVRSVIRHALTYHISKR